MSAIALTKRSHADSDRALRERKADQITRILGQTGKDLAKCDVLDIGTGAGYISSFLSRRACSLVSVDVVDERVVHDFAFRLVDSERLPLPDASVDIVVSNHVIEHVDDQSLHLREIRRVLRADGVCYLATPNRFALIEPHFRLPLLSWIPTSMRHRYVRGARKGARYDVYPLTFWDLNQLARRSRMHVEDRSMHLASRALAGVTGLTLRPPALMRSLLPSFVVLLRVAE